MMYPYITLADETEITFSHVIERNSRNEIEVHFERATEDGFNIARCVLPDYQWIKQEGFTPSELSFFEQLLRCNAHLFYKYAASGGVGIA